MNISAINLITNKNTFPKFHKEKINYNFNTSPFNVSSQDVLANYNKNLVTFTGVKIDENFFQLPPSAKPDDYQMQAAKSLHAGKSVLVSAPTGTGKTAIAKYIISKNLADGEKTFYTTPLKALSNQKLLEFRETYGDENVGILTGDRKENVGAPILVMTTEVYRNMAFDKYFNNNDNLASDVKTIIFDEFHYLGDPDRGASWEESVIFSPKDRQILGLSATIGNDEQLSNWLQDIGSNNIDLVHVPPEKRHVPLKFYMYDSPKNVLFELDKSKLYGVEEKNDAKGAKSSKRKTKSHQQRLPYSDDYMNVVNRLNKEDKLPAILFVFNKKFSKNLLDMFEQRGKSLTTLEEKNEIERIITDYEKQHSYIGEDINREALLKGYAVHNAGILPIQKQLIEELFNKKLLKVVIATETLAAGINMPARTVVISSSDKPTSDPSALNGRRILSANEFHQMAGRAGRRGIDNVGHVVVLSVNPSTEDNFKKLVASSPNPIYSVFEPNYSLIANYHKYTKNSEKIKDLFADSFKIFTSGEGNNIKKINAMYKRYEAKSDLMEKEGFLQIFKNREKVLTPKGHLLPNIVGYPQIPLINLITSKALEKATPEDLTFLAGSIVGSQYKSKMDTEEMDSDNLFSYKIKASDLVMSNLFSSRRYFMDLPDIKSFPMLDNITKSYNSHNNSYKNNLNKFGISDEQSQDLNLFVGSLIYSFAFMNGYNQDNSVQNWKVITSLIPPNGPIRDEGACFNAINQTIDLLGQMIDLCKNTKNIYEYKDDQFYYEALTSKLKKAIKLLKQPPMQNYLYEN